MPNIVDEFVHECLAIRINRKLKSMNVIDVLADLFTLPGIPGHIRSDNGPEFGEIFYTLEEARIIIESWR